jgi:glycosyltransferase involved in cell wall biosynthesis
VARILILVENLSVPFDRRVWQESRALVEAGHEVCVICPRGAKRDTEPYARIEGIEIHRYALETAGGALRGYVREYGTALWRSLRLARQLDRERPFDVVQACNPPDLLFLVALPLKLRGARFVFDHHDLVPELFRSRFEKGGPLLWANQLLERLTFRLADHVISTNESYREVAVQRGHVARERTTVVRSAPDLTRFVAAAPDDTLRRGRKHLVCYLGVMGPQDGVDYALRALASVRDDLHRDDVQAAFVGHGDSWDDLVALAHELGLDDRVEFTGRVSDDDLARYLSTADVCLAPDPKNPLNDVSTMNKIVEYMAMSRPLVSFDLIEARVSAGDAAVYATPNDEREFARLVAELLDDPERRARMGALGRQRVEQELSWEHSRRHLLEAYDALLARGGALRSGGRKRL